MHIPERISTEKAVKQDMGSTICSIPDSIPSQTQGPVNADCRAHLHHFTLTKSRNDLIERKIKLSWSANMTCERSCETAKVVKLEISPTSSGYFALHFPLCEDIRSLTLPAVLVLNLLTIQEACDKTLRRNYPL